MRIGIFTDTYPPYINGVSTSILVLQKALEKKGHEVFIVTVNDKKMEYDFQSNKIIKIPGILIGIYDYRLTGIYPFRVIKKIKKWNLDVIHSHTEFGVGMFARIVSKQFDIPLVHTYHTMYEEYVHYVTKGYFVGASRKIVEYLTNFYCDKTATELIVPTKKTYDFFKGKYRYQRSIHIVPTGIPLEKYYRENYDKLKIVKLRKQYNIDPDDFVVLFVGRIAPEKRIEFLLDVHHFLVRKYKKLKLLIIGDGPSLKKYKSIVKKNDNESSVIFTGKVPYEKIGLYYQLGTIFATASDTETQGLTVVEALAASLPIVVIDDESFKTAIENGLNGYTFKNKGEYRKIIEKLINNSNMVSHMKIQARNSAEKHSDRYFADRTVSVYKTAISKNGPKRSFFGRFKKELKRNIYGK